MNLAPAPLDRGTLWKAARSALVFDRTRVDAGFAVRCTVGVAIPLFIAFLAGKPALGVPGAIGAMSVGFASLQGRYRTRAAVMLLTSGAMALATLVGSLAGHSTLALVAVVAVWAYAYGVFACLGQSAATVGLNSMVALIVFSGQGADPATAPLQAALVFAGGLLQTALLVLVWPLSGYAVERRALAAAYRGLAAYATTVASGSYEMPDAQRIAAVRTTLADPQPFARRGDISAFQSLLDSAERIRAGLASLASERAGLAFGADDAESDAIGGVAKASAPLLIALAEALEDARAPQTTGDVWEGADEAAERAEGVHGAFAAHVCDETRALFGQIRSAWNVASYPARDAERVPHGELGARPPAFPSLDDALLTLRSSVGLRSPFGRHALRLAVTLALATALYRGFSLDRGYWMTLTAALILKPDFSTSFARGLLRLGGTLLGALLASGIALAMPLGARTDAGLAIVFAALGYLAINVNYGLFGVTVTAYVVFLLSLLGLSEHAAIAERVRATLYGGALAELATFLWPTWEGRRAGEQLAALLEQLRRYASLVFAAYAEPEARDRDAIRSVQAAAWNARLEAETSVDRALLEPSRTHVLPPAALLGILAATRRIGVGLLTLNARLNFAAPRARPALRRFADAVASALETLVRGAREGGLPAPLPPLRRTFDGMRRELDESEDPEAPLLAAECDLVVDAVNTIGSILGRGSPSVPG